MDNAQRRLKQLQSILQPADLQLKQLLVLPDDAKVFIATSSTGGPRTRIAIDGTSVLEFRRLAQEVSLVLSALGTPFEDDNPTPKYPVLELSLSEDLPKDIELSRADLWAAIYALWTLLHEQEYIPITLLSPFKDQQSLQDYLLTSGLARKPLSSSPLSSKPILFLIRGTFWQGAGQGPLWWPSDVCARSWLPSAYGALASSFPHTPSFTRTPLVIASHPLRPPKPTPGTLLYKRYVVPLALTLTFHAFDPHSDAHMDAFHRWMNDERVNRGWGERGTLDKHRAYVRKVVEEEDGVLPMMMSWDGELMGYCELVWIRENHVATYIPEGPLDHDRGLHVLVGEEKYRGDKYGQHWFRSVTHFIFLSDPRTLRIVGEPKRNNPAIIKMSIDAGMHLQTSFHFPYKHSVMTMNLRERFFKEDMLT